MKEITENDSMKEITIRIRAEQIEQLMFLVVDDEGEQNAAARRYLKVIVTKMLEEESYETIKALIEGKDLEKALSTLIVKLGWADASLTPNQLLDQMTDPDSDIFARLSSLIESLSRLSQFALASLSEL